MSLEPAGSTNSEASSAAPVDPLIRRALPDDCQTIANLVYELAVYEKLERFVLAGPEHFRHHLFGPRPYAFALIAEVDGQPAGFALSFPTFSTFRGQPGLYLEDLYVKPEHRGRGIGKALLASMAALARQQGLGRLEWAVLDWNTPAISFYESLGARLLSDWKLYRLDELALEAVASQAGPLSETDAPPLA